MIQSKATPILYMVELTEYTQETTLKFVVEATWNWIHSAVPHFGEEFSAVDDVPPEIFTRLGEEHKVKAGGEDEPEGEDVFYVSSGSWENDRAMAAPSAILNGEETPTYYDKARDGRRAAKD